MTQEPKKEGATPAPADAVPRNGSGADTAFIAMVKKRKGLDAAPPEPPHAPAEDSQPGE